MIIGSLTYSMVSSDNNQQVERDKAVRDQAAEARQYVTRRYVAGIFTRLAGFLQSAGNNLAGALGRGFRTGSRGWQVLHPRITIAFSDLCGRFCAEVC